MDGEYCNVTGPDGDVMHWLYCNRLIPGEQDGGDRGGEQVPGAGSAGADAGEGDGGDQQYVEHGESPETGASSVRASA